MITNTHPILDVLAREPRWEFTLIGSRLVDKVRMDDKHTDWDFLVDGTKGPEGAPNYQNVRDIEKFLLQKGFEQVTRGGYSEDPGAYHYRWRGDGEVSVVDVLVTRHGGEFARRMKLMNKMKARYGYLRKALSKNSKAWGELWHLLHEWEK